jgi:hypothetical protein
MALSAKSIDEKKWVWKMQIKLSNRRRQAPLNTIVAAGYSGRGRSEI